MKNFLTGLGVLLFALLVVISLIIGGFMLMGPAFVFVIVVFVFISFVVIETYDDIVSLGESINNKLKAKGDK